jgi:hypothetical protein
VFGRRKREEAAAEAARETQRRALFEKLAERPENICPFLGLAGERTGYVDGVSDEHRCYAFGDPAPLSAEQQTRVCQQRGYGNCPRYLRGVLVIPTEELEALRRPRAAAPVPPPRAEPERGRRRAPLLVLLVLLLAVGLGGGVAWLLLGRDQVAAPVISPSPTASPTAAPTDTPAPTETAEPTPSPDATRTPDPTPRPEDVFEFYEVQVEPGDYVIFQVNDAGEVEASRDAAFSARSQARVDRIEASNGLLHWRTAEGTDYLGWSYISPESGSFEIWAVYRRADGTRSSERLPDEEL